MWAPVILASILSLYFLRLRLRGRQYPPGPRRLPVVGNLLDIPSSHAHTKFAQYTKDLGSDIIYLDTIGVPFIVLNSLGACTDLLEKRSSVYSDRFHLTMAYELMEGKRLIAMLPYGNEWREGRKIMTQHLNSPDQVSITSITRFARKSLLPNLLETPDDFLTHIRNSIAGSMISLTYGLPIKRLNDPWIIIAEEAMECVNAALVPGRFVVDYVPFLQYLPEWFPGTKFHKQAREWKRTFARMFEEPFDAMQKGQWDASIEPSFLSKILEETPQYANKDLLEKLTKNIGGTFLGGGIDTKVAGVTTFVSILLLFPDVLKRAQAEIDEIIGRDRLPDLADKPNLPYFNAVLKEALRWRPIAPFGLPHMTSDDDVYRDYYIPKGSIVFANTWAIFHDESRFPDPSRFDPTRFLTPSGELVEDMLDPEVKCTFGFGRRACPGAKIGLASLWLNAASIVASFDITPELDPNGKPVRPKIKYVGAGPISPPEPFKCRIMPRDAKAISLIQAECNEESEYI